MKMLGCYFGAERALPEIDHETTTNFLLLLLPLSLFFVSLFQQPEMRGTDSLYNEQ